MQLILLSMIHFFPLVKATGTYNNIDNLLTLLHVRSDILYIEGVNRNNLDDLIKLVATLFFFYFILFSILFLLKFNCFFF